MNLFLEIGSGSGIHLVCRAGKDPSSLYIGFELRFKRTFKAAEKAEQNKLKNLLIIRANASLITEVFSQNSIDGIYINFPDPWAKKKRWNKNRLINTTFISSIHPILKPNGFISYKTDHKEYFDSTLKLFEDSELFQVSKVTNNLHLSTYGDENIFTEFEMLFKSKGLAISFLEARKL